jgi:ABC-2 type transport system ATP-binding protein
MLEVRNITKKYNHVPVVKDICFSVKEGEILGLAGPDDSGKSTILKILAGLVEPTMGEIYSNGLKINPAKEEFKQNVGYLPEDSDIFTSINGRAYLQLAGSLHALPDDLLNGKINGLITQLGMNSEVHLPMSSCPKGLRQKILLAAALLHNPDILLLDNPLEGTDIQTILAFKNILTRLAAMGKIIIYCSSDPETIEMICSRLIIIKGGKIAADAPISHLKYLISHPSLESIFKNPPRETYTARTARSIIAFMEAS